MKLDLHNYRILYELDVNARQPIKAIAQKIRLSKDTTLYRIRQLEKDGIILRYQAYINHGKLGYLSSRINFKLQNTTPDKEQEIINFIKEQPSVGFFASVEGNVDLVVWILIKSAKELDTFWQAVLSHYANYIEKTELGMYTKIVHYPRSFLINKKNNSEMLFTSIDLEEKVDKSDLEILKILTKNARENVVDMARRLKLSPKTVSKKIKNLEKRKIIEGYTALFDIQKLGYLYYKLYFDLQNITSLLLKRLDQFIFEHPNIIYRDYVIGGHFCEIEVQVKNDNELRIFIDEIKKEFSTMIRNHEVLHYYKEHKMLSMPWSE